MEDDEQELVHKQPWTELHPLPFWHCIPPQLKAVKVPNVLLSNEQAFIVEVPLASDQTMSGPLADTVPFTTPV